MPARRAPLTMANVKPVRLVGGGMRGASSFVRLELDQKSLARGYALLDRYRDAPLQKRMAKAALAAAKVMEGPIRDATPVSHDKDPGGLRKSVKARPWRSRKTFVAGKGWRTTSTSEANVGPLAPHRRLVIRGHRIVTRGGRDTGRRTRPNPYVDMVAARHYKRAIEAMRAEIFNRGMQEDLQRRILYGRNAG